MLRCASPFLSSPLCPSRKQVQVTVSFLSDLWLNELRRVQLLGDATDQLSLKLGQTLSGLLNASFGNAVEIIVGIAALLQGELRIVQTSMLGSILSNLLLVLGCSFLAGAWKRKENSFQAAAAQTSLMTLACITLVIPAAYHSSKVADDQPFGTDIDSLKELFGSFALGGQHLSPRDASTTGLLTISRGTAILLLLVYVAYLYFQLKSHAYIFEAESEPEPEAQEMSVVAAGTAWVSELFLHCHATYYLINKTATRYHIPKAFIGIILLPIVANAAEHVTSVWMAMKDKTELTIGICVGSSIQIATFVVPLLVIVGWMFTIALFVSVLLVNLLIMDGKSNYMEGLMLITLYIVIALAFWVS
ncbi:Sodium/calcium exchanger protein-domain-containing protein [Phellopilus nigrolimitatus]|nr:Sodium/calcium exchanger protein-domain-containing protein [Phellopilus nigrolimitatus]